MNVKWIIEGGVLPEEVTNDIVLTLKTNNLSYNLVYDNAEAIGKIMATQDLCIPYGSVGMVRSLIECPCKNLLMWYDKKVLSWEGINEHWNKFILNQDNETTSLINFKNNLPYFYSRFGKVVNGRNVLFIKPFENDKSFTGMILMEFAAEGTIDKLIKDDGYFQRVNADTMVVISSPKFVINEWRFFIADSQIIASSQYNKNRSKYYSEECSESNAIDLVEKAIVVWEPDEAYSLDICESDGRFYIMEIGCLNCSDIYAANKTDFFSKITKIVESRIV